MTHNPFWNAYPVGGRPWTAEEDQTLLAMLSAKALHRDISKALSRTIPAIKSRRQFLALGLRRERETWTAQETELAEKLVLEGADEATCRAQLGRSRQACKDRIRRCEDAFGQVRRSGFVVENPLKIPDSVLEERNKRLMARYEMDLTAITFGDPEPGRMRL